MWPAEAVEESAVTPPKVLVMERNWTKSDMGRAEG
jgi:hypothetical protein